MSKRWLGVVLLAGAMSQCSLLTDFDGVTDGSPDGSAGQGGSAGSAGGPPFPRLASIETRNPKQFEAASYQQAAARQSFSILGVYPGWEDTHGPLEQVAGNVKALNPESKLLVLVSAASFRTDAAGDAYSTVIDKLNDESWWLYESGGSGAIVASPYPNEWATNTTLFTPEDSDGLTFIEWFARWSIATYFVPNPSLDGVYVDDDAVRPFVSGDLDRDGSFDDASDAEAAAWQRAGYRRLFDDLKSLSSERLVLANLHSFASSGAVTAELEGVLHGGVLLDLIGQDGSIETQSWNAMMSEYRTALAAVIAPKLVMFHASVAVNDFRTLRYALASCLMDDGYFAATDDDTGHWGIPWFDELDVDLGLATSPPPTQPWSNGVYRRDFEKGIALVNPRGNGTVTVELESEFVHLSGAQDPVVNDGSATQSVTLPERDGVLLLRPAPN